MSNPALPTDRDPVARPIADPVIRLRAVGTGQLFPLIDAKQWIVGTDQSCSIQLHDPTRRVSRRHMLLRRQAGGAWFATDLGSTNGIRHNGYDRATFQVVPGDEIELGGTTLIAESRRTTALHELLRCVLGWASSSTAAVDRAFRAIREMASLRVALILGGQPALHHLANRLHDLALHGRSFVMREPAESGVAARARAGDGTLCLDAKALPPDLDTLIADLGLPGARTRLVICAESARAAARIACRIPQLATIEVPPMQARAPELERLFEACCVAAAAQLGVVRPTLQPGDLAQVRIWGVAPTFAQLTEDARRLVALRTWQVTEAAARLDVSPNALVQWTRRRLLRR